MFSPNDNKYQNTDDYEENQQNFEHTSKFQNEENLNYEDSGNKFQNDILDEGEREAFHKENEEKNENYQHEEAEAIDQNMDYENNQYYEDNAYKNLQRNNDYKYQNEYEVVNVEHQIENDEEQKYYNSDENFAKTPDKNDKKIMSSISKNTSNPIKNSNLTQIKEESERTQTNPVQPNDINFYKLKNSKLFQKFLKEEGQTQKKIINNYITVVPEEKPSIPNDIIKKTSNPTNPEYQKNLKNEEIKNEENPRRVTPLKQEKPKEKEEKYNSQNNINEDDKELAGYSQIVPGNIYQPDLIRNNYVQGIPYDYSMNSMNPALLVYNDPYNNYRNQNPQINDYAQKNYYSSANNNNNNNNIEVYLNKINELNEMLNKEVNNNQILEKKCNEFMIYNEQISSNYEDLKRKFMQSNGAQRGDTNRYEEKINLLNQNLMENEKKLKELLEENENLKWKMNQEMNLKTRFEDDKKQMNSYIEQLRNETQEKENVLLKRSDDNVLLKRSVDNLKNEIYQMKAAKEKLEEKIKELEMQSLNFNNDLDFERKKFADAKDRNKNLEFDNEKSRNELNLLRTQINNLLLENENCKNEIYNQKQYLQDKNQKELQITVMLEKANMEINQFKTLLARTEKNLSDQREINQSLIKKISDIAKDKTTYERVTNYKNSPTPIRPAIEHSSPSESTQNNQRNLSNDKTRGDQQEYYVPTNKWSQQKIQPERNQSSDIALLNNSAVNKSAIVHSNPNLNNNYNNNPILQNNYKIMPSQNLNNSSIRTKNYQNAGNILEWQEKDNANVSIVQRRQNNLQNLREKNNFNNQIEKDTSNNQNQFDVPRNKSQFNSDIEEKNNEKKTYFTQKEKNENPVNSQAKRAMIPESRDKFVKTSEQDYQNTLNTIKNVEKNLMLAQIQKEKLENDLRKLEEVRTKSSANIRRKAEIDEELRILSANISHLKNKLREMNALHFY